MPAHDYREYYRGQPLRRVTAIERVPVGKGHMKRCYLACGHSVDHMSGHKVKIRQFTHCPECK